MFPKVKFNASNYDAYLMFTLFESELLHLECKMIVPHMLSSRRYENYTKLPKTVHNWSKKKEKKDKHPKKNTLE